MAHPSPVLRVAVVEDDARFRSSLEMFFTNTPEFSLTGTYRSARAALEALDRFLACGEEAPWDLVLMDLELPGMSGIEATRRLKERSPTLPVIVLTVFEEPGTILEAITSGADGYLVKRITGWSCDRS